MLIDQIREDLKTAMRSRESARVEVLRFLLSEVKNVGINEKRELDDGVVMQVLQKLAKQRKEGIDQFQAAQRQDLVDKEKAELAILESYLPKQLSDSDLEQTLRGVIAEVGAASKKDMGKVMKAASEKLRGAADGRRIQAAAAKLLP
jgi:uncharacterized protein YqeY